MQNVCGDRETDSDLVFLWEWGLVCAFGELKEARESEHYFQSCHWLFLNILLCFIWSTSIWSNRRLISPRSTNDTSDAVFRGDKLISEKFGPNTGYGDWPDLIAIAKAAILFFNTSVWRLTRWYSVFETPLVEFSSFFISPFNRSFSTFSRIFSSPIDLSRDPYFFLISSTSRSSNF